MIPFKFVKEANVSTAGKTVTAPGSSNMPGAGYGAASIPGMSIHCLSCGKKVKKGTPKCVCGADVSRVVSASKEKDVKEGDSEVAETGGEAAVNDAKSTDVTQDLDKYSSAVNLLKPVVGGAALVGGAYGASKLTPIFAAGAKSAKQEEIARLVAEGKLPQEELAKFSAARRAGNPILNIRLAKKKLQQASGNFRKKVVRKK